MNAVTGGKRAVNLSLSAALVERVRQITPNLSETVETLLTQFLAEEQARQSEWRVRRDEAIRFLNARDERQGVWSDEFPL